jgi:hypothetical protein
LFVNKIKVKVLLHQKLNYIEAFTITTCLSSPICLIQAVFSVLVDVVEFILWLRCPLSLLSKGHCGLFPRGKMTRALG